MSDNHYSDVSPDDVLPKRLGEVVTEQGRIIQVIAQVYNYRIVVKSPTRRVELAMDVTERERHALASLIRPPVSPATPEVESSFSGEKVSAQEWLREHADLLADVQEQGVVVSDNRESDTDPDTFTAIAQYIDWLEESVRERDEMIERRDELLNSAIGKGLDGEQIERLRMRD
jgi:hypothetical protein